MVMTPLIFTPDNEKNYDNEAIQNVTMEYRGADSLDRPNWKNNWKVTIFRLKQRSLLPRRPGWTDNLLNCFWVVCKEFGHCSLFPSWSG